MYFCTTYLAKEKNYNTIGGLILSSVLLPSEHVPKCMFTIFHEIPRKKFAIISVVVDLILRFPTSQSSSSISS